MSELALVKVPLPLDVQVIPALLFELAPVVIFIVPVVEQVIIAEPATAVGAAVMLSDLVEVALVQPASAFAVSVKVTPPAEISAALGV